MRISTLIHGGASVIVGGISYYLGGFDFLLKSLFFLTILDMLTGTGQSIFNRNFSARKCCDGIIKKVFIYLTVALAVGVDRFLNGVPIREMVITFYIISEGMSNLENIGKVIKYPEKLKTIFVQLKETKLE